MLTIWEPLGNHLRTICEPPNGVLSIIWGSLEGPKSASARACAVAAECFGRVALRADVELLSALARALCDPRGVVRERAAKSMGKVAPRGDSMAVAALATTLADARLLATPTHRIAASYFVPKTPRSNCGFLIGHLYQKKTLWRQVTPAEVDHFAIVPGCFKSPVHSDLMPDHNNSVGILLYTRLRQHGVPCAQLQRYFNYTATRMRRLVIRHTFPTSSFRLRMNSAYLWNSTPLI